MKNWTKEKTASYRFSDEEAEETTYYQARVETDTVWIVRDSQLLYHLIDKREDHYALDVVSTDMDAHTGV